MKFTEVFTAEMYSKHLHYIYNLPKGGLLYLTGANLKNSDLVAGNFTGADFEYSNISNSILDISDFTHARFHKTNLTGSSIANATFIGVSLTDCNLSDASLNRTNFTNALLYGSNLDNTTLWRTKFTGAKLDGVSLEGASLCNCIGDGTVIRTLYIAPWRINVYNDIMAIGCEQHTIEQWYNFTDIQIDIMNKNALQWWYTNKDTIKTWINKG
jgi:uncharacterized protein YjbI with pentapeptide repeats